MAELAAALARRRSMNGEGVIPPTQLSTSEANISNQPISLLPNQSKVDDVNQIQRMHEQEKSFMVDLDRDGCEVALNDKIVGAFMLRPKDENSFVISVKIESRPDQPVDHYVIHRVAGMYQRENNTGVAITSLHEFLIDLRSKEKLPKLVYFKSEEATKKQSDDKKMEELTEEELLRPRGTMDELDELDDFLKDEELMKELNKTEDEESKSEGRDSWRLSKGDNLFGLRSDDLFGGGGGGDLKETDLFTEAAGSDELNTAMQLKDLQMENRKLRQQVNELMFHLRKRDEDLAVSTAKIAQLSALLPNNDRGDGQGDATAALHSDDESSHDVSRAKDLLKSKLGEFGFSAFNVETALDDINQAKPIENMDITVNEVLDRLTSEGQGSENQSGILGLSEENGYTSSFLGSKKQTVVTPKASQFGLFGEDENDKNAGEKGDEKDTKTKESSKSSDSTLFSGVADVDAKEKKRGNGGGGPPDEGVVLSYNDFIARLMRPESSNLVLQLKLFISSVLGPNGDATPPPKQQVLEYRFYGDYMLQERCVEFFEQMEGMMSKHVAWQDIGDAGLIAARNNFEKFVMTKIADIAFNTSKDEEQDYEVSRRMAVLSFLTPESLEVNPNLQNDVVWSIAQEELRKMASFKCPGDKIACVVKCCQVIFSVLNLQRGSDDTSRPGADDFLPIFIYVVLKSNVPHLYSNCEYIQNYHNPSALMSKSGYCFVNLRSAIEFILTLDGSVLNMDKAEFDTKLAEGEAAWNSTHTNKSVSTKTYR